MIKAITIMLRLGLMLNSFFLTASIFLDLLQADILYFFIGLEIVLLLSYGIFQVVIQIIGTIDYKLSDIDISSLKERLHAYKLTAN